MSIRTNKHVIDVCESAARLLKASGFNGVAVKRLDSFTGKEGICVRRLPYTVTHRYQDTEQGISYIFQVVVRNRSEEKAIELCCEIADLIQTSELESINGSYAFVGSEIYTEPQELELEDAGFYAYELRACAYISRKPQPIE